MLVVGHQTSGKSALIEALMGFQFNQVRMYMIYIFGGVGIAGATCAGPVAGVPSWRRGERSQRGLRGVPVPTWYAGAADSSGRWWCGGGELSDEGGTATVAGVSEYSSFVLRGYAAWIGGVRSLGATNFPSERTPGMTAGDGTAVQIVFDRSVEKRRHAGAWPAVNRLS